MGRVSLRMSRSSCRGRLQRVPSSGTNESGVWGPRRVPVRRTQGPHRSPDRLLPSSLQTGTLTKNYLPSILHPGTSPRLLWGFVSAPSSYPTTIFLPHHQILVTYDKESKVNSSRLEELTLFLSLRQNQISSLRGDVFRKERSPFFSVPGLFRS